MTSDNRNVTRLKVDREEWRKIESGETSFILRETQSPYKTVAFVFTDALTGTHLGNATTLSEIPFGDYEASPWTWSMFAKLTDMTEQELKEKLEQKDAENDQLRAMLLELEKRSAKLEKNASN